MDEDEIIIPLCIIIIASVVQRNIERRRRRRRWVRNWIQTRGQFGAHHALVQELAIEESLDFRSFLRMVVNDFQELLGKVTPFIQRQDTRMREAISTSERLSLTLRYSATTLHKSFFKPCEI